jgi:hypothetical protein
MIIVGTMALWIIYDIYIWNKGEKTISQYIRQWSEAALPISFLMGYVMGHFTWPL